MLVAPLQRSNQNTELYVSSQSSTLDYLSKLVAREHCKGEEAQTPVVSPDATAAPVVEEPLSAAPMAACHSQERQSIGGCHDVVLFASPTKVQTTLQSFMKPLSPAKSEGSYGEQ